MPAKAALSARIKGHFGRFRRTVVALLAGALATFFVAKATGALEWAEAQTWDRLFTPAVLAIEVEADPAVFDATAPFDWERYDYIVPRPLAQVPAPPGGTCRDRHRWARTLDGVDAGRTKVRIYLRGLSEKGVVIDSARAVIDSRKQALGGTHAACSVGGAQANPVALFVYLDARRPHIHYGRRDEEPRAFLLTLEKGEIQPLELVAFAGRLDVSWWLELAVHAGDGASWVRVDDEGRPFRTSGIRRATPATYEQGKWHHDPTARESWVGPPGPNQ